LARIDSEARDRIMAVADRLFSERGLSAVSIKEIADEVGIRHPTLYHHFPGGKEQLYIEVTERNLKHHQHGLEQAIQQARPEIRHQLQAVARWFLSQPPMDLVRFAHSDIPEIDVGAGQRLLYLSRTSILMPIEITLREAQKRGEIDHPTLDILSGAIVGLIEQMYAVPYVSSAQRLEMANSLIDVVLNGIYKK
jgi:AcrR family transcriptional regulator